MMKFILYLFLIWFCMGLIHNSNVWIKILLKYNFSSEETMTFFCELYTALFSPFWLWSAAEHGNRSWWNLAHAYLQIRLTASTPYQEYVNELKHKSETISSGSLTSLPAIALASSATKL